MNNVKDPYLIEYLVKSGYDRKKVTSDEFNIDDLNDTFSTPIDLSKISSLEEIKIFFMVSVSLLVGEDDIKSGRAYTVSKLLPDFKMIGKEPGLKLNRLFVWKNAISVVKKGEPNRSIESHISLDNFDLNELNFEFGDRNAGVVFGTNEFPDFSFLNCSNVELSKFNELESNFSLDLVGCRNVSCKEKANFRRLNVEDYREDKTDFLKNIFAYRLLLTNLSSLDLANIGGFGTIRINTVENCYSSENCEIKEPVHFFNVSFSNPYETVTTIKTADMEQCEKQDASTMFDIENAEFKKCNFNLVLGSKVNKNLIIKECYDVDKRIEEIIDISDGIDDFSLSISNIEGYDIRKLYNVIDLNSPANMDLLFDDEKLTEVLKENKYLKAIQVIANLSDKQRAILGKYASDAQYGYVSSFFGISDKVGNKSEYDFYNFSDNATEKVNFEKFMLAEKMYQNILKGIKKNWTELEKFKYIYNALGKMVSYDINTLSKNDDAESQNRANLVARNPFSSILTGQGICAGYAEMYVYACRKAGLFCEIEHGDGHAYNLITYKGDKGNNVKSYCDLTWDAFRIKGGFECEYFARGYEEFDPDSLGHRKLKNLNAKELDREYVEEIDNEIGYHYLDEKYDKLVDKAKKMRDVGKRTKYLLDKLVKIKDTSEMSNREVMVLANSMLARVGKKPAVGTASAFIRRDTSNDKDVREILWIKTGNEYLYYTFNLEQQEYKLLRKEVVLELLASGMMELYKDEILPGFEKWIPEKDYEIMKQYGLVDDRKHKGKVGLDR